MRPLIFKLILTVAISLNYFVSAQSLVEHSIKFVDQSNAVLVGEDGLALKTTDGGSSWENINTGITNVLYGNDVLDANTSLAVGENGVIMKTTNAGINWELKESGILTHLYDIEIINSTTVAACGEDGILLLSYNMGDTWEQVYTQPGVFLKDLAFFDSETGYAVGSGSRVLKTSDGGVSWTDLRISISQFDINAIGIKSGNDLTLAGNGGMVYNSTDGGYTWIALETSLLNVNIYDIVYYNNLEGILVGENSTILKTFDGGLTWQGVVNNANVGLIDLNSVAFSSVSTGILVGEDDVKLYTGDGGTTWNKSKPATKFSIPSVTVIKNAGNFPNPFNPSTTISFELPNSAFLTVQVFDISGRQIAELYNGNSASGIQEFKFDASSLSSGVYFYRISAKMSGGTSNITGRMLLVK